MTEHMATAIDHVSDDSVTGEGGSNVTVIRIEQPKESWWKQPATYIAILAFLVAFWAEREARLGEYYSIDLEMYAKKLAMTINRRRGSFGVTGISQ